MQISKERMSLTSGSADEVLGTSVAIDGDYSLQAFVRAIVLKYGQCPSDELGPLSRIEKVRVRDSDDMKYVMTDGTAPLYIVECVNCIESSISADGWVSEYAINGRQFLPSRYLSQFCKTKIFINQELQRIVAFVDRRASHVWTQAFESIIARLMPWYFPHDLTDEEKHLFTTISEAGGKINNQDAERVFLSFVNSAAEGLDLRQMQLHRMLDGIADRARQLRLNKLIDERNRYVERIKEYNDALRNYYASYDRTVSEITALESAPPNTDTAMFDFFNNHKQLTVMDTSNGIQFCVADTLEFYDEDAFDRVVRNKSSYFANYEPMVQKALCGIFRERRGVIRVQAVFELAGMTLVTPKKGMMLDNGCMPNPHIYYYACSGGNDQYYSQFADSGDWDLGIEQAISATKNINWGDSIVCQKMIALLMDSRDMCIYINDDLSPVDAVDSTMTLVTFNEFMKRMAALEETKED